MCFLRKFPFLLPLLCLLFSSVMPPDSLPFFKFSLLHTHFLCYFPSPSLLPPLRLSSSLRIYSRESSPSAAHGVQQRVVASAYSVACIVQGGVPALQVNEQCTLASWEKVKMQFGPSFYNCSNYTPIQFKLMILCNYTPVRILNISLDFTCLFFILVHDF